MSSRVGRVLLILVALSLALLPRGTFAAQPQVQVITFNDTSSAPDISAACGFDVNRTVVGTIRDALHVDSSGNPTVEILTGALHITFTGNGQSYTYPDVSAEHINYALGTDTVTGLNWHVAVPGEGPVSIDVGRLVFDANGNLIFQAGQRDDFSSLVVAGICSHLSS